MGAPGEYRVLGSTRRFEGHVISVRSDEVAMPDGAVAVRDVVEHPGAVAVVALDGDGRVVLVEQYRHAVGERLWELPAGLLDVAGEPALEAAARELVEETGLTAGSWLVLADALTTPGGSDEAVRLYLARGLGEVPQPPGRYEEAEMRLARVPLADAVARVLSGDIRNSLACIGILAASAVLAAGSADALRPADAPWPDRPGLAPAAVRAGVPAAVPAPEPDAVPDAAP